MREVQLYGEGDKIERFRRIQLNDNLDEHSCKEILSAKPHLSVIWQSDTTFEILLADLSRIRFAIGGIDVRLALTSTYAFSGNRAALGLPSSVSSMALHDASFAVACGTHVALFQWDESSKTSTLIARVDTRKLVADVQLSGDHLTVVFANGAVSTYRTTPSAPTPQQRISTKADISMGVASTVVLLPNASLAAPTLRRSALRRLLPASSSLPLRHDDAAARHSFHFSIRTGLAELQRSEQPGQLSPLFHAACRQLAKGLGISPRRAGSELLHVHAAMLQPVECTVVHVPWVRTVPMHTDVHIHRLLVARGVSRIHIPSSWSQDSAAGQAWDGWTARDPSDTARSGEDKGYSALNTLDQSILSELLQVACEAQLVYEIWTATGVAGTPTIRQRMCMPLQQASTESTPVRGSMVGACPTPHIHRARRATRAFDATPTPSSWITSLGTPKALMRGQSTVASVAMPLKDWGAGSLTGHCTFAFSCQPQAPSSATVAGSVGAGKQMEADATDVVTCSAAQWTAFRTFPAAGRANVVVDTSSYVLRVFSTHDRGDGEASLGAMGSDVGSLELPLYAVQITAPVAMTAGVGRAIAENAAAQHGTVAVLHDGPRGAHVRLQWSVRTRGQESQICRLRIECDSECDAKRWHQAISAAASRAAARAEAAEEWGRLSFAKDAQADPEDPLLSNLSFEASPDGSSPHARREQAQTDWKIIVVNAEWHAGTQSLAVVLRDGSLHVICGSTLQWMQRQPSGLVEQYSFVHPPRSHPHGGPDHTVETVVARIPVMCASYMDSNGGTGINIPSGRLHVQWHADGGALLIVDDAAHLWLASRALILQRLHAYHDRDERSDSYSLPLYEGQSNNSRLQRGSVARVSVCPLGRPMHGSAAKTAVTATRLNPRELGSLAVITFSNGDVHLCSIASRLHPYDFVPPAALSMPRGAGLPLTPTIVASTRNVCYDGAASLLALVMGQPVAIPMLQTLGHLVSALVMEAERQHSAPRAAKESVRPEPGIDGPTVLDWVNRMVQRSLPSWHVGAYRVGLPWEQASRSSPVYAETDCPGNVMVDRVLHGLNQPVGRLLYGHRQPTHSSSHPVDTTDDTESQAWALHDATLLLSTLSSAPDELRPAVATLALGALLVQTVECALRSSSLLMSPASAGINPRIQSVLVDWHMRYIQCLMSQQWYLVCMHSTGS